MEREPIGIELGEVPCNPRGCALLCTEEGLRAAHRAHHSRMLKRARRIVVDPDLAEEAVQEAFLRAWQNCASFDPDGAPLVHWLLTITRNVAIDLVKARTRRPPVAGAQVDEPTHDVPTGLTDTDRVLLRDQLARALSTIGPEHREAVVQTILRDRPQQEVAADLGIPAGTIRSRVHYALRRLRDAIEAAEAGPRTGQLPCA